MTFSLVLLGSFQLRSDKLPIPVVLAPARALLAYLAVEADRPHQRELLAALLWSDHPQAAAYSNLRQTLARLRKALPNPSDLDAMLAITPQTIQLNLAGVDVDVARFSALLAAYEAHPHADRATCAACRTRRAQAEALYSGELLYGHFAEGKQPFEDWLSLKRETIRQQALEAMQMLTRAHAGIGDYDRMRHYATRQLTLDPWCEQAHRDLMCALAMSGNRPAALAQYEIYRQVLQHELGIDPDAETKALYATIQAGILAKPPGAGG